MVSLIARFGSSQITLRLFKLLINVFLPHQFVIEDLVTLEDVCDAIASMHVRGAGVIGASGAYGMYIASLEAKRNNISDIQSFFD